MAITSNRSEPDETGERQSGHVAPSGVLVPVGGRGLGALTTGRDVALVKACQCQRLVIGIAIGVPTVMSDRPGARVDRDH